MMIFLSNFLLSHYIFKHKPKLSVQGHEAEKNYIYLQSMAMAVGLTVAFTAVLTTALVSDFNNDYITYSMNSTAVLLVIMRIWLKKKKPKNVSVFEE